jgi:hypothetical protein
MKIPKKLKLAAAFALAVAAGAMGQQWRDAAQRHVTPLYSAKATSSCADVPEYRLPSAVPPQNPGKDTWRIRIGMWKIANGGHHAFLEFLPFNGDEGPCMPEDVGYQVHGLMMDGHTRTYGHIDFTRPGFYKEELTGYYDLKAVGVMASHKYPFFMQEKVAYVDIYYDSKDEILKMYLDAMALAQEINAESLGYYMLSQNSNSVFRAMIDGLGLPLPDELEPGMVSALKNQGKIWWTPGLDKRILPWAWDRQQVRRDGGYNNLVGDKLEKAVRRSLIHPEKLWEDEHPAPPPEPEKPPAKPEPEKPPVTPRP